MQHVNKIYPVTVQTDWQRDKTGRRENSSYILATVGGPVKCLQDGGGKGTGSRNLTHRHEAQASEHDQQRKGRSEDACSGSGLRGWGPRRREGRRN